nr:hypothetical protein [Bradyrhizobium neotropicale]
MNTQDLTLLAEMATPLAAGTAFSAGQDRISDDERTIPLPATDEFVSDGQADR